MRFCEGYPGFDEEEWRGGEPGQEVGGRKALFLDLDLSQTFRRAQDLTTHACPPFTHD